jgi:hypothetical protein
MLERDGASLHPGVDSRAGMLGRAATASILLACLAAAAGCVRVGKAHPETCPEYANLVCMTEIKCDWDEERKCNACACHNEPSGEDPLHPSPYMPPGSGGQKGGAVPP